MKQQNELDKSFIVVLKNAACLYVVLIVNIYTY